MAHKIPTIKPENDKFKERPKGWKPPKIPKPKGEPTDFEKYMRGKPKKKYGGGKVIHKKTGSTIKHANEFEGVKVKKRPRKKYIMESPPENRKIPSQEKSRTVPENIYSLLAETLDSVISKKLLREIIEKQGTKKERRRASEFSSGEPHRKRKIQKGFTEPKSRQHREKHVSYKSKGSKVKYRSIGGKVTNGNDITGMVYD